MLLPDLRSAERASHSKITDSRSGSCRAIINSTSYLDELRDSFCTFIMCRILLAQKVFTSIDKTERSEAEIRYSEGGKRHIESVRTVSDR